ncbi:glycosyltransferase [Georgenia yuyongxinii]|uniref:Glycosyltransferase family 4 protein n=1 Tax=Georgenia yuyongxinii TaxID=2589797 RepID=A0A552WQH6_9MICO|nr:glycosyltransferase [Georgenia yuyongxinii]TRW44733.1 glycosyltransferase family 4 protein [Georgenia yuyongxinii]
MRVLVWHVHGSWLTGFLQGAHDYLLPVVPGRGPDGRGRARTWSWPANAREVTPAGLREAACDVVVLQRADELRLLEEWTGLRAGVDVPAVYVEHNAPPEKAAATVHPLAGRSDIPVVHVTAFNALMWDCGTAPTAVIEHGVPDPGYRYTGESERLGVVVNEPVRRWRVAGTDVLLRLAETVPVEVYGMGMAALAQRAPSLTGFLHDDVPQDAMHDLLARHRAYLHPYRWTSLGLSLIEAMLLGLPVLALATTAAPESVPTTAGVVSADPGALAAAARRWLADPAEAHERGLAAREHALARFGLARFLDQWDQVLKEVVR